MADGEIASTAGAVGMSSGNPYGMIVGAALSIYGNDKKKKKAEADKNAALAMLPPEEDPAQVNFFHEIDRKRKSFADGTAFAGDLARLGEVDANVRRGIISASGGAGGAAISGMIRSKRATQDEFGKILGEGRKMEFAYNQFGADLLDRIAQRRMDIASQKAQISLGMAMNSGRTANENTYGAAVAGGSALGQILNKNNTGNTYNTYNSPGQPYSGVPNMSAQNPPVTYTDYSSGEIYR